MTSVVIDPVTRIEGHARVVFDVDEADRVIQARLIVNELRGFERILVGMQADRMPLITARICGVCPSAHHLASVHALDSLADNPPPAAARLLRELLYMGHIIHSHTLSLFVLQGPDLLLGSSESPASRNIVGVVSAHPELAQKALRLRSLGQKINELIGGRGIHPVTAVPGGITFELDAERHDKLKVWTEEALALAQELVPVARTAFLRRLEQQPELATGWKIPACQLATVDGGTPRFCEGQLQIRNADGNVVDAFASRDYAAHLVEVAQNDSYLKPVFARIGACESICRVGPLARINAAERMSTPLADAELGRFQRELGRPCHLTLAQIWARAIELLSVTERALEIAHDPTIRGPSRVPVTLKSGRAVGHVEAPRGTLIHDFEVDDQGIVREANLIVATQFNYAAINQSLLQAYDRIPHSRGGSEALDAVEFAIRCYDPCLSCATHAIGRMPLQVQVRRAGTIVDEFRRPS